MIVDVIPQIADISANFQICFTCNDFELAVEAFGVGPGGEIIVNTNLENTAVTAADIMVFLDCNPVAFTYTRGVITVPTPPPISITGSVISVMALGQCTNNAIFPTTPPPPLLTSSSRIAEIREYIKTLPKPR